MLLLFSEKLWFCKCRTVLTDAPYDPRRMIKDQ